MDTETSYLKYYRDGVLIESNPLDSFLNYKLLNATRAEFDCDSCLETKIAMKEIFGESQYTDTLISPQSYFTQYLRYFHSDILEYSNRKKDYIVPNIPILQQQMVEEGIVREGNTIKNPAVWAYFVKINNIEVDESILTFLHVVYTLPNFSSVCRAFNVGRAFKTRDNFLIALYHIYSYYDKQKEGYSEDNLRNTLGKFLSPTSFLKQEDVITEVQNWLNRHESFSQFIEKYYLQAFLEDPSNSHSIPKELWDGIYSGKLHPTKEEFLPSIKFLTQAIENRGKRLTKSR